MNYKYASVLEFGKYWESLSRWEYHLFGERYFRREGEVESRKKKERNRNQSRVQECSASSLENVATEHYLGVGAREETGSRRAQRSGEEEELEPSHSPET